MARISLEGYGERRIDPDPEYQGVDDGVPLLSTFYFRFEKKDSSEGVDNHINAIMVLPAGAAEDASPNAETPLQIVGSRKIRLMYQDAEADAAKDRYFYRMAHSVRPFSSARRFQIRDIGCQGECKRDLPPPQVVHPSADRGVFVLVGFQLYFTGGRDHHIDKIAIFEEDGNLTVRLNDRHNDDDDDSPVFAYLVDYAWVSRHSQNVHLAKESGSARGLKVIRGFEFDFVSGDHHLREVGVLMNNENLEVYYGDKNGDDLFEWTVHWAKITPIDIG